MAGGMDRELREKGIRVTAICPAAVHTEFAMGKRGAPRTCRGLADVMRPEDIASAIDHGARNSPAGCVPSSGRCGGMTQSS